MTCVLLFLFRILFKDKDRNWDEIESKLRSENDTSLPKSSNKVQKPICLSKDLVKKSAECYWELILFFFFVVFCSPPQEISSILVELKRVEKQLQGKQM